MKQQQVCRKIITLAVILQTSTPFVVYGSPIFQDEQDATIQDNDLVLFHNASLSPTDLTTAEYYFKSLQSPLGYSELTDYAMVHMLQNKFEEAALLYELAYKHANNDQDRVFALMLQGQALLDSTYNMDLPTREASFARAGVIFNSVATISTESREIALLRATAWANAGDQLEFAAAQHDLKRLGTELDSDAILLPIGLAIGVSYASTILAASAGTVAIGTWAYVALSDLSQEEKIDRMMGILKIVTAGSILSKTRLPKIINMAD